ncbi:MAG: helix-turn-helix domain-containing protein [Treponema sp.]|nr:helix-turn-helix domain-containing protein [Treponema sp.]
MEEKAETESIPQLFGKNVQKYRKEVGLTQEQLSERLKISQKHLSIVETGTQFASASLIGKIAKELNVSPAMLFGGSRNDINYAEVNAIAVMMQNVIQGRMSALESRLDRMEQLLQNR